MGQLLSNLAVGSLVKLNEDGQAKQFIVIGKDHYGTGTGVTLIRKDAFAPSAWNVVPYFSTSSTPELKSRGYAGTYLDNFCDGIWPEKLDDAVRSCLVLVPIQVINHVGIPPTDRYLSTLYRKGFALSLREMDNISQAGEFARTNEGTGFAFFESEENRIACYEGTQEKVCWGLRTMYAGDYDKNPAAGYIDENGRCQTSNRKFETYFSPRPAFNLKSTVVVSSVKDSDDCYTIESVPTKGGGLYVKNGGMWVKAV